MIRTEVSLWNYKRKEKPIFILTSRDRRKKPRFSVYDLGIKVRQKWEAYRLLSTKGNVYLPLKRSKLRLSYIYSKRRWESKFINVNNLNIIYQIEQWRNYLSTNDRGAQKEDIYYHLQWNIETFETIFLIIKRKNYLIADSFETLVCISTVLLLLAISTIPEKFRKLIQKSL